MSSIAMLIKLVPAGGSGESHNGFTSNHRCRSRAIRPNWMRRNRLTQHQWLCYCGLDKPHSAQKYSACISPLHTYS